VSWSFRSHLAPHFDRFVQLKRAGGAGYKSQASLLRQFDTFLLDEQHLRLPLCSDTVVAFLATLEHLTPRGRDNVVDVVWQALVFASRHGASIDRLPPRPPRPPAGHRLRPPRLVFEDELRLILQAARGLRSVRQLRGATYATLYGLLFTTGMRISEALALDVGDIDFAAGLITIRRGKFGKSRVLPLKPSALEALGRYLSDPRRSAPRTASHPIFISKRRRRLGYDVALDTFRALVRTAGLEHPLPCPHDLRHSFTVLRVVEWYRDGRHVDGLLPALATYLGHVSIDHTRTYLRGNGLLLAEASRRFQLGSAALDEVLR
jgi:integrase